MPHLTTTIQLIELQCGTCGVHHAIPKAMYDAALEDGGYWHCPNGHQRGFREGRKQREEIVRERDRLKQIVAQKDDEIAQARSGWEKAEKLLKKERARISAGVCPCCNRTFQNLKRHMETKHSGANGAKVVTLKSA